MDELSRDVRGTTELSRPKSAKALYNASWQLANNLLQGFNFGSVIIYFMLGKVLKFSARIGVASLVAALAIFLVILTAGVYNPARSATSCTSVGGRSPVPKAKSKPPVFQLYR